MKSIDTHQPLEHADSIRILELVRFDPSKGQLLGRLITTRLTHRPNFIAMSHVWGIGSLNKSILLADELSQPISEALFNGLKELSSRADNILVWVDLICIRQGDLQEKEQQISLMGRIYSQAREVVAWLGDAHSGIGTGIKLLRVLGELEDEEPGSNNQHNQTEFRRLFQELAEDISVDSLENLFDFRNVAWQGAISLVQRPWFSRLWVVQEVALSRDLEILCGRYTISGTSFFRAVRIISTFVTYPPRPLLPAFHNAQKLGALRAQLSSTQCYSYLNLAHELSEWDCFDDRDRLHALMGMVFRDTPSWFPPSYDTSVEELYETFARAYISTTGRLDILHFSGDSRVLVLRDGNDYQVLSTCRPSFPICSWAPDWRIKTRPIPLHLIFERNNPTKSPTSCRSNYGFHRSNKMLRVQARLVDEVALVGPPLIDGIHSSINLDVIFNVWYKLAQKASQGANDIDERFASTLILNEITAASQDSDPPSKSAEYVRFKHWASRILVHAGKPGHLSKEEWNGIQNNPIQEGIEESTKYGYKALENCQYRSFFITKSGKFGLGPAQAPQSSSIYLVQGLMTPFLLQKSPDDDGYYLRGECYVEGLMNKHIPESDHDTYVDLI